MITKVTLANDLYGVVPKGSQPTFKLVAGQVQVDTPLTLLNSTVQAPKVAYQEVKPKQTTAEAAEESNEHSGDTTVAEPNHFYSQIDCHKCFSPFRANLLSNYPSASKTFRTSEKTRQRKQ
ncbi:hypothetical protein EfsSVR2281_39500 [Enterococcus faecalis]|nr:hypothetical protein EfsSVR2281_39500 [Enterococcus faecalis]